jgi:hypothetical protein
VPVKSLVDLNAIDALDRHVEKRRVSVSSARKEKEKTVEPLLRFQEGFSGQLKTQYPPESESGMWADMSM